MSNISSHTHIRQVCTLSLVFHFNCQPLPGGAAYPVPRDAGRLRVAATDASFGHTFGLAGLLVDARPYPAFRSGGSAPHPVRVRPRRVFQTGPSAVRAQLAVG